MIVRSKICICIDLTILHAEQSAKPSRVPIPPQFSDAHRRSNWTGGDHVESHAEPGLVAILSVPSSSRLTSRYMPPAIAAEVMSWVLMWPTQFAIMSRFARMVMVAGASGKLPDDEFM